MHILASGPEQQAVYFGHVIQAEMENKGALKKKLFKKMIEATVFLGTFNAADIFSYPSPDLCLDTILSRSSTDNSFELMGWFLL
jgi:hypothetical protein